MPSLPERYVHLCLDIDRIIDGFVDVYYGPPEWRARALAEDPREPRALRDEAEALVDGLSAEDIEAPRRRWLRAQLEALVCVTARLVGDEVPWADEVERCMGVRPARTDTEVFEIAATLSDLGIDFAPGVAAEVHRADIALYAAVTDAAFMLHEDGATAEEAEEYLREWGLQSNGMATRIVESILDPTWRAYTSSYSDGHRLCRDFIDRAPGNFTRLLTEQLAPADLSG